MSGHEAGVAADQLPHPLLAHVDVEVDGGVEDSQQMGHLRGLVHPAWPLEVLLTYMGKLLL